MDGRRSRTCPGKRRAPASEPALNGTFELVVQHRTGLFEAHDAVAVDDEGPRVAGYAVSLIGFRIVVLVHMNEDHLVLVLFHERLDHLQLSIARRAMCR